MFLFVIFFVSLGDLVANISIAKTSPETSIAACFGTPLLSKQKNKKQT